LSNITVMCRTAADEFTDDVFTAVRFRMRRGSNVQRFFDRFAIKLKYTSLI
jgi:hypothetical protein